MTRRAYGMAALLVGRGMGDDLKLILSPEITQKTMTRKKANGNYADLSCREQENTANTN